MIDQTTIDRILDAAQIVDVVSEFVTLRKRGVNYVGLCPFHNERLRHSVSLQPKDFVNVSAAAKVETQSTSSWSTNRCRITRH